MQNLDRKPIKNCHVKIVRVLVSRLVSNSNDHTRTQDVGGLVLWKYVCERDMDQS